MHCKHTSRGSSRVHGDPLSKGRFLTDDKLSFLFDSTLDIHQTWLASRGPSDSPLAPGAQRPLTLTNFRLACLIAVRFARPLYISLWDLQPTRTVAMFLFSAARGVLPALRGYSHLRLADEVILLSSQSHSYLIRYQVQALITSGSWDSSRLAVDVSLEFVRMVLEFAIDTLACVSAKFIRAALIFKYI
jgi:hypothetical protein